LATTLARLGTADLSRLLGDETVRLLEMLDPHNLTPSFLAEQVLRQRGPEGLLDAPTLVRHRPYQSPCPSVPSPRTPLSQLRRIAALPADLNIGILE
jgi:hypothetical protein